MNKIVSHCTTEVMDVVVCYKGSEPMMMSCLNCIWGIFIEDCMDCVALEDVYASCGDVCAPQSQCDQALLNVYQCGQRSPGVYLAEE